jgi:hypothetical protein
MFFDEIQWVIPEILGSLAVFILFALTGRWLIMLFNLPMTVWLIYCHTTVPSGNVGIYDPVQMYSQINLRSHMHRNLFKITFYLISFLVYLYSLIISIIARH